MLTTRLLGSRQLQKISFTQLARARLSTVPKEPLLALPETAEETVNIGVNDTYKLKELGPVGKQPSFLNANTILII